MTAQASKSYNVSEYVQKAHNAILRLRNTQTPGQCTGNGGKNDVLRAVRGELQALLADGYTSKQIADAFAADVFAILPKTITQLAAYKASNKRRTPRAKKTATVAEQTAQQPTPTAATTPPTTTKPTTKQQAVTPGAFNVTPDSEDL